MSPKKKPKSKAPETTLEETKYLRQLADDATTIRVRLANNDEFRGTIEFFDQSFIRLTRPDGPNLFLYKHDIKYLWEDDD